MSRTQPYPSTTAASADRLFPSSGSAPAAPHPQDVSGHRRLTVVFKLGTSSICHESTHRPLLSNISMVIETIVRLRDLGHRAILVTSGAVGVGLRRLNIPSRPKVLAQVQALAAVGQGRLMSLYDDLFSQFNTPIAQILLTKNDLADKTQYVNAVNTLNELLALDVVPIVNENDTISVGEIRFGDNDTLSGITAGMVGADYLFLLTDVDCLYTDNPRSCPDAKPIGDVQDVAALREKVTVTTPGSSLGTGGMVTKLIAADLATAAGVTTVISNGSVPQRTLAVLAAAHPDAFPTKVEVPPCDFVCPEGCTSDIIGRQTPFGTVQLHTRFLAKPNTLLNRTWWVLHGLHTAGNLIVDEDAVVKTARHKTSLFSSGIVQVEGQFEAQTAVKVYVERQGPNGESERVMIGKGLVNYASSEIDTIKGRDSKDIPELLGFADADSVIHSENFAITIAPEDVQAD